MLSLEKRKDNSKLEIVPQGDNVWWGIMEWCNHNYEWYNSGICGEAISLADATVTSYLIYRDYLEGKSEVEIFENIKKAKSKSGTNECPF